MNKTTYTFNVNQALLLPETITLDENVRIEVYINGSRLSALDNIHRQGHVVVLPFYHRHSDDVIEIDVYDAVVVPEQETGDDTSTGNTDAPANDLTNDTVSDIAVSVAVAENSDNNAILVTKQQQGMNSLNGHIMRGIDHLEQSVSDILLTPLGSRVMRRNYGSNLYLLKDQRMTSSNIMRIYSAVAEALQLWEPRILLDRVFIDEHDVSEGRLIVGLQWRIAAFYSDQFPVNDECFTQRLQVAS